MLGRTGLFRSLYQLCTVQWYERVIIYLNSPHVDNHTGFFPTHDPAGSLVRTSLSEG